MERREEAAGKMTNTRESKREAVNLIADRRVFCQLHLRKFAVHWHITRMIYSS